MFGHRHTPAGQLFRAWHRVLIAALVLAAVLRMPFAATHLDLARDLFVARRLLDGEEFPLAGPILAGAIHLGPAWYWLLAALLALGRSWLGALLLLGGLVGSQYWLAYLAGRALHGRSAGLAWAVGLMLPSWSAYEWLLPLHTSLTAPLVLALILCSARFLRRPRFKYLCGMLLAAVLCLHAHPSTIGLLALVASVLALTAWQGRLDRRELVVALLLAATPLLPYLAWSAAHGFTDFQAGAHYLTDGQSTGSLRRLLPLVAATAWGGTRYWMAVMLGWSAAAIVVAGAALAGGTALACAGLMRGVARPQGRAVALVAVALMLWVAASIALIRQGTPYYMTTPLRVVMLGLVALGLAELGCGTAARALRGAALVAALALGGLGTAVAARSMVQGNWRFAFLPLFDVTTTAQDAHPLPLLPAYAMAPSGRLLCATPGTAAHGAYARHLMYDYAIEMRLACARSDVTIGGEQAHGDAWFGLAWAAARAAELAPTRRLGSLALFPVRRVIAGTASAAPAAPIYPIHLPRENAREERRYHLRLAADERLAVVNLAYFVPDPQVREVAAEPALLPLTHDAVSRVWTCAACRPGTSVDVELAVASAYFDDVEILVF